MFDNLGNSRNLGLLEFSYFPLFGVTRKESYVHVYIYSFVYVYIYMYMYIQTLTLRSLANTN